MFKIYLLGMDINKTIWILEIERDLRKGAKISPETPYLPIRIFYYKSLRCLNKIRDYIMKQLLRLF